MIAALQSYLLRMYDFRYNVRILFAPYADGKANHLQRRNRVKRIADLLNANNIISNIAEI